MTRKFHGRYKKSKWNWWQLLLFRLFYFWCAVDWCIFPILVTVSSLLKKKSKRGEIAGEEDDDEDEGRNEETEKGLMFTGIEKFARIQQ